MQLNFGRTLLAGLAAATMLTAVALPAQAATLRMAWSQDATGLDPHKQTAFSSLRLLELVYECGNLQHPPFVSGDFLLEILEPFYPDQRFGRQPHQPVHFIGGNSDNGILFGGF